MILTFFPTDLMLENLAALSCRSMRLRRIWRTSSLTSGSSFREKDSSGSRKELGSAVSMLVVWKPAVTWKETFRVQRPKRKKHFLSIGKNRQPLTLYCYLNCTYFLPKGDIYCIHGDRIYYINHFIHSYNNNSSLHLHI